MAFYLAVTYRQPCVLVTRSPLVLSLVGDSSVTSMTDKVRLIYRIKIALSFSKPVLLSLNMRGVSYFLMGALSGKHVACSELSHQGT